MSEDLWIEEDKDIGWFWIYKIVNSKFQHKGLLLYSNKDLSPVNELYTFFKNNRKLEPHEIVKYKLLGYI